MSKWSPVIVPPRAAPAAAQLKGLVERALRGEAGDFPSFDPEDGEVAFAARGGDVVRAWATGKVKPLGSQFGGYTPTAKTAQRGTVTYAGVDAVGMVIPILFDGWLDSASVAPARRTLEAMASPSGPNEQIPPQPIRITGSVLPYRHGPPNRPPGTGWVIGSLEPGDIELLRQGDVSQLRTDYVVTVYAPPVDGVIITNGGRYTVRTGDTLTSIAARQLGDGKRWEEIKDANGHKIRDPKSVTPGQIVRLP